ncbi:MAG: hypothetical protein ACRBK7_23580 [Acidimicrobiales bacterium]
MPTSKSTAKKANRRPAKKAARAATPSYLGLLNAIAVAETAAEPLFTAWADKTDDAELEKTLRFVGMREGEHGKAFAKRMLELGYEVREPAVPGPDPELLKIAGSRRSDLRKFSDLGFGRGQADSDVFDNMFNDKNIDPITGGLLGRYIAEERDSVRRLSADHQRISDAAQKKKKPAKKKPAKKN